MFASNFWNHFSLLPISMTLVYQYFVIFSKLLKFIVLFFYFNNFYFALYFQVRANHVTSHFWAPKQQKFWKQRFACKQKRVEIFKSAEKYVKEYQNRERDELRLAVRKAVRNGLNDFDRFKLMKAESARLPITTHWKLPARLELWRPKPSLSWPSLWSLWWVCISEVWFLLKIPKLTIKHRNFEQKRQAE